MDKYYEEIMYLRKRAASELSFECASLIKKTNIDPVNYDVICVCNPVVWTVDIELSRIRILPLTQTFT